MSREQTQVQQWRRERLKDSTNWTSEAARLRSVAMAEASLPPEAAPLGRKRYQSQRSMIRNTFLLWNACCTIAEVRPRAATGEPLPSKVMRPKRQPIYPIPTPPHNTPVLPPFQPEPLQTPAPLPVPPVPALAFRLHRGDAPHDESVEGPAAEPGTEVVQEPNDLRSDTFEDERDVSQSVLPSSLIGGSDPKLDGHDQSEQHPSVLQTSNVETATGSSSSTSSSQKIASTGKGKGKAIDNVASDFVTPRQAGVGHSVLDSSLGRSRQHLPEKHANSIPGSSGATPRTSLNTTTKDDLKNIASIVAAILMAQDSRSMLLKDLLVEVKDLEGEWGVNWLKRVFKMHDFLVQTETQEGFVCRYEESFDYDFDKRWSCNVRFNAERSAGK